MTNSTDIYHIPGWFSWLGFWAMLHEPVHFVVFLLLLIIIPLECYSVFIVFALYTYLKEAYIDVIYSIHPRRPDGKIVVVSDNSWTGVGGK